MVVLLLYRRITPDRCGGKVAAMQPPAATFGTAGSRLEEWLRLSFGLTTGAPAVVESESALDRRERLQQQQQQQQQRPSGIAPLWQMVHLCVPRVLLVRGHGPGFGVSTLLAWTTNPIHQRYKVATGLPLVLGRAGGGGVVCL